MKDSNSIHSTLFDLIFLIQIEMKKVLKNTGADLSPAEILILRTLVKYGETTQQQLVQRLSKDKAQITRLIQGLVKKELIFKQSNPDDKRSFVITARPTVKKKMLGFIAYERKIVQKILVGASDEEMKNLAGLLVIMINNLRFN